MSEREFTRLVGRSVGRSLGRKLLFVFPLTNAQLRMYVNTLELFKKNLESICCPSYEIDAGSWQAGVLIT